MEESEADDVERSFGLCVSLAGWVRVGALGQPRTALHGRASARPRCGSQPLTPRKVLRFPGRMLVRDSEIERITGQKALMNATSIIGGVWEPSRQ
jgi:hypothetical protein